MLFRMRVQCDQEVTEAAVWQAARDLERRDLTTSAIDPFRRHFGLCLTTEGYESAPFAKLDQELREKALQVVHAEERHQSDCKWRSINIPS
jgi:hypothetical protein